MSPERTGEDVAICLNVDYLLEAVLASNTGDARDCLTFQHCGVMGAVKVNSAGPAWSVTMPRPLPAWWAAEVKAAAQPAPAPAIAQEPAREPKPARKPRAVARPSGIPDGAPATVPADGIDWRSFGERWFNGETLAAMARQTGISVYKMDREIGKFGYTAKAKAAYRTAQAVGA